MAGAWDSLTPLDCACQQVGDLVLSCDRQIRKALLEWLYTCICDVGFHWHCRRIEFHALNSQKGKDLRIHQAP